MAGVALIATFFAVLGETANGVQRPAGELPGEGA